MTQWYRDFDEYSTGSVASVASADWSVYALGANWTAEIVASGTTGTNAMEVDRDVIEDAVNQIVFDTAGDQTGDVEVLVKFKMGGVGTGNPFGAMLVQESDGSIYGFDYNSGTVTLAEYDSAFSKQNTIDSISLTVSLNTYYWIRLGRSGTTIQAKMWLDSGSEPDSWDMSATDTALGTVTPGVGCLFRYSPVIMTVDVFGVGTSGDAAPSSGAGGGSTPHHLTLMGVGD